MNEDTHSLLDKAEDEHGPKGTWRDPWAEDSMFVPYQPGELWDLGLRHDEEGFLTPLEDADDDFYEAPEIPSNCRLFVPDGMIVWMECNHPGRIYISGRDWFEWSDFNGYFPCEVTWDFALSCITSRDGERPWNLEVCGPLPAECRAAMEKIHGKADPG